jgi:hypothetical protein
MKHVKEDGKFVCPICADKFTHPVSLKNHIIKKHEKDDAAEKGIEAEQIVGPIYKRQKVAPIKTSFEEMKQTQTLFSNCVVSKEIFDVALKFSVHCPKLHQLLMLGTRGAEHD